MAFAERHGGGDPREIIRRLIGAEVQQYALLFPEGLPHLDLEAFASLKGIAIREDLPLFSDDAELQPAEDGGVVIVIHPGRPAVRRRFSIGHEYTHTLFPGYGTSVQCRCASTDEGGAPEDLERLCDLGASFLVMPDPWFTGDLAASSLAAAEILPLLDRYEVSPDAFAIRAAGAHPGFLLAICFHWGWTKEERERGAPPDARKLRIRYFVRSPLAARDGSHIPINKSVAPGSLVERASRSGDIADAVEDLDLGTFRGRFRTTAIPLYTPEPDASAGLRRVMGLFRPA